MRRSISIILLCLLLAGCAAPKEAETDLHAAIPVPSVPAVTSSADAVPGPEPETPHRDKTVDCGSHRFYRDGEEIVVYAILSDSGVVLYEDEARTELVCMLSIPEDLTEAADAEATLELIGPGNEGWSSASLELKYPGGAYASLYWTYSSTHGYQLDPRYTQYPAPSSPNG